MGEVLGSPLDSEHFANAVFLGIYFREQRSDSRLIEPHITILRVKEVAPQYEAQTFGHRIDPGGGLSIGPSDALDQAAPEDFAVNRRRRLGTQAWHVQDTRDQLRFFSR
jgi:hypothetical protein